MFNRILVTLDGSPLAERALPHAEAVARIFNSTIVLLQVLDPSPFRDNPSAMEPLSWQIRKAEAGMYLAGISERLTAQGIPNEHVLREGRTPENIVDYAHSADIDLLVMSTHGIGGLSRWNTSSVTAKVADKIYLPMLVVRAYQSRSEALAAEQEDSAEKSLLNKSLGKETDLKHLPERAGEFQRETDTGQIAVTAGPLTKPVRYRKILMPIDSSRRAECALTAGVSLIQGDSKNPEGSEKELRLVLAAVIKPPELPVPEPYPQEIRNLVDQFMTISREAVNTYMEDLKNRVAVDCEVRVAENESVPQAIHEMAEEIDADLVVLCAHGKTGRTNMPYGSVSRNYIQYGDRTVLIIQDVPLSQVRPTPVEIAAEKSGRR